jgi:Ran GTPase-activating protein (RanGAP) involved in mRNA processing and transport
MFRDCVASHAVAAAIEKSAGTTTLHIRGRKIPKKRFKNIAAALLLRNATVTTLKLQFCSIRDYGIQALASALGKMTRLDLSQNHIKYEGCKALAAALETSTTLTEIVLACNYICPDGAKVLALALAKNKTLTTLDLSSNCVGDEGGVALADALAKSDTLTTMALWYNGIGDAGATAFASALLKNKTITTLDIGSPDIGVSGAMALADAAARSRSLTKLTVGIFHISRYQRYMNAAVHRGVHSRLLLAFVGALVPGREKSGTPAERFVLRDGDTALGHRIAEFLVEW